MDLKSYTTALSVCLISIIIFYVPSLASWLEIAPTDLGSKPWAIVTTHLVHLNEAHLIVNLLALLLLNFLFSDALSNRILLNVLIITSVTASLLPVGLEIDIPYVGLSGVLHGIFVYGAITTLRKDKKFGVILLALVVIKLVWDMFNSGQAVEWLGGATVAYLVHVGGAFGGAISVPMLRDRAARILGQRK